MKKIFLSIILIILLTGCSAEYNLEFKNGQFNDNIKIGAFNIKDFLDYETFEPTASYKDYNIKYYDFNYKDNYLYLNHEYSYNEYRVSTALIDCFNLAGVSYDEDYYYILTSGEFKCMNYMGYKSEEVKINFKTDLEVESSNADIVNDRVYSWIFNDGNYKNKEINIKLIRADDSKDIVEEKSAYDNFTLLYFLIIIPLLILLYVAYKKFKKYSDSKNKIPD